MDVELGVPSRVVSSTRSTTQEEPDSWLSVASRWFLFTIETEDQTEATAEPEPTGVIRIETLTRMSMQLDLKALLGLSDQETKWCVEMIKAWWASAGCGSSSKSEYSTTAKTITNGKKDNMWRVQQWVCTRREKATTTVPLRQKSQRQRIEELNEIVTEKSKNGLLNDDSKETDLEFDTDQVKLSPLAPPPSINEQQQQDGEQELSWIEIGSIMLTLVHNKVRIKLKKVVSKLVKFANVGP